VLRPVDQPWAPKGAVNNVKLKVALDSKEQVQEMLAEARAKKLEMKRAEEADALAALRREEKTISMIVDQERLSAQRSKDAMAKEAVLKAAEDAEKTRLMKEKKEKIERHQSQLIKGAWGVPRARRR